MAEDRAVSLFREYLQIRSVSSVDKPPMEYDACIDFLTKMAKEIGLPYRIIEVNKDPKREVFLMTWEGRDPKLPAVLLNSHYDVVPVFPEFWTHEPFSAYKDESGDIYARGTQDMKSVTIQYIEAVRKLKEQGYRPLRTVHLSMVPDEEVTGRLGMGKFVDSEEFKRLNLGLALDEGLANTSDNFTVFYGERSPWWARITCTGDPGHGSRFITNTAAEKVRKVINSALGFRDQQEQRLKDDSTLRLGDVTTCNLTIIEGGVQFNVVPTEMKLSFDIRVTPNMMSTMDAEIKRWCTEAGSGVTYEFEQKFVGNMVTPLSDDNPWWSAFLSACDAMNMKIEKEIFPAATDSRFLRSNGLPAIGFSPMNNTPILLHDNNERLNEKIFLKGIDIYCKIISAVADVPANGV